MYLGRDEDWREGRERKGGRGRGERERGHSQRAHRHTASPSLLLLHLCPLFAVGNECIEGHGILQSLVHWKGSHDKSHDHHTINKLFTW